MKKFYVSFIACLLFASTVFSADRFWVGAPGAAWNAASSWSTTSGGSGGASVPSTTDRAIFNANTSVNINLANITVSSVLVTNNAVVNWNTATGCTFKVTSSIVATPGLKIDAGAALNTNTTADVAFEVVFDATTNARGNIDGNWSFNGTVLLLTGGSGARFTAAAGTVVNITGRVTFNENTNDITPNTTTASLTFGPSSFYTINKDGGSIPLATYDATSTIEVLGAVFSLPTIIVSGAPPTIGGLTINTPLLADNSALLLADGTTIKGDLQILNTNGFTLELMNNNVTYISPVSLAVNGNFIISGANSNVIFAATDISNTGSSYEIAIDKNFTLSNGAFALQTQNGMTGVTTMKVKGNFSHTGGIFSVPSTAINATANLFIIELNGNTAQTFGTIAGTIDNAQNMVALKLNNTSGGVALTTPLSVGRISFQLGILTTTAINLLTINEASNAAVVVENPSTSSFVNGPLVRNTNTATAYTLPTGKTTVYDPVIIVPNTTTASAYKAEYFNTGFGDYTTNATLTGVSNSEYWNVVRNSGADAQIRLTLNGAVANATAIDTLVVAKYNGADWINERGTTGTFIYPGNVSTGTIISQLQTGFGFFTFGIKVNLVALPINLLDFAATKKGNNAVIEWKVDKLSTAAKFEVLESTDGKNFTTLTTINAVAAQINYSTTDVLLQNGSNYYRLKMYDKNGEITFSKVVAVLNKVKDLEIVNLAPTLVTGSAVLNISTAQGGSMDVYITDMMGRVWRKFGVTLSSGSNQVNLNLGDLSAGVYHVNGVMEKEQTNTVRFIKQ
jgi:hypothetical protein